MDIFCIGWFSISRNVLSFLMPGEKFSFVQAIKQVRSYPATCFIPAWFSGRVWCFTEHVPPFLWLIAHIVSCGVCIREAKDGPGTVAISVGTELLAEDLWVWLWTAVQGLGTGTMGHLRDTGMSWEVSQSIWGCCWGGSGTVEVRGCFREVISPSSMALGQAPVTHFCCSVPEHLCSDGKFRHLPLM